jgi:hypothetical protein
MKIRRRAVDMQRRLPVAFWLAAGALVLTACSGTSSPELPSRWTGGADSEIILREGGAGSVTRLPLWEGTAPCSVDSSSPYTGRIRWSRGEGSSVVIGGPYSETYLWPDGTGFGSLTWDKLYLGPCGKDTGREDVIEYFLDSRYDP